jgi:hypothetical protein
MSKMKKTNSVIGVFQLFLDLSKVYCFKWSSYSCNGVIIIITSGCPWPKATVKSLVGARDLRPL